MGLEEALTLMNSVWEWAAANYYSVAIVSIPIAAAAAVFWCNAIGSRNLPPGPIQWPIVGSLLSVGFQYRHRTFAELAKRYGPLMHLRLGASDILVISSPELAMEVLKTKDAEWSSRPLGSAGKYIGFDFHSLNFSPSGPHWRHLRKICATQLFSPGRIKAQARIRREELLRVVDHIFSASQRGEAINLRNECDSVIVNTITRMLFGNRYAQSEHPIAKEMDSFMDVVKEAMIVIGALIVSDLVPALDWLDLQGYDRRMKNISQKLARVFKLIIDDHRRDLENKKECDISEESKDFVDILLSLQGQDQLSEKSLMGIMTDVLLIGMDITSSVIEWAMAELIRSPRALTKLKEEIDNVVSDGRLVDESDISQIPYLESVAKETLRLHPPAPMTDPHYNEEPVDLAGYRIPAKFIAFVNIWGIGHDPKLWDEASEFKPERFDGSTSPGSSLGVNYDFKLLPFSSGRRQCPAANMAFLEVQHAIALLVHAFDWSLPEGELEVNMEEGVGIVAPKKFPLLAMAKPRLDFTKLCSL